MEKVSIIILNYNGEKLLPICLPTVLDLKYRDKEIIFLDNASTDNSAQYVMRHFPQIRVIANKDNSGYAGGANQAVDVSEGEFVLIMNPDIVFAPDYLDVLLNRLRHDEKIGAIIGKLRKYDFAHNQKTDLLDSAGLLMRRDRRCVDRGQGEPDQGQYDKAEEVFGITGASPLYRRKALEDVKIEGEYFDSGFFMYKEDVDISWRLRLFGWKCFYEPKALAHHGRGTGAIDRASLFDIAKYRKGLSKFQKILSYKNERLMRVKNDFAADIARDFLPILWKEILMTGWMIAREQFLFKAFFKFLAQLPQALLKRREIMRRRRVGSKEMKRWFE